MRKREDTINQKLNPSIYWKLIFLRECVGYFTVFRDYYQQYLSEIENCYDETGDIVYNDEVNAAIPDETQNSILQFVYMIDLSDVLVVALQI